MSSILGLAEVVNAAEATCERVALATVATVAEGLDTVCEIDSPRGETVSVLNSSATYEVSG